MPNRHYIEITTAKTFGGKLVTRIPTDDFEESKRAAGLLAAEFFPEDPNAAFACSRGVYHYDSVNDHGENVTIQPVISPLELAVGENMDEIGIAPRMFIS